VLTLVQFHLLLNVYSGQGVVEADESCKKFMEETLPDIFFKVRIAC